MSVEGLFSSEMRRQIKQFPVWRPGDPVEPADIGTLSDGVFRKQTTLSKVFPELRFKITNAKLENPYLFVSSSAKKGAVQASAPNPSGIPVKASMKIEFGGKGAVVFAATDINRKSIEDIYQLRQYIKKNKSEWPKGMVLAAVVETAGAFRVLVSESKNGSVSLSGDAKALGAINIADASVGISLENAGGYDSQRARGPIAVTAYGFNWWDALRGRIQLLEHDDEAVTVEDDDFAELSADDYPDDEEDE